MKSNTIQFLNQLAALVVLCGLLCSCEPREAMPEPYIDTRPSTITLDRNVLIENNGAMVAMLEEHSIDYRSRARTRILPEIRNIEAALREDNLEKLLTAFHRADLEKVSPDGQVSTLVAALRPLVESGETRGDYWKILSLCALRDEVVAGRIQWDIGVWVNASKPHEYSFVVSPNIPDGEGETENWKSAMLLVFLSEPDGSQKVTLDTYIENRLLENVIE